MEHRIAVNDTITLVIDAAEPFSTETVKVTKGEVYHVFCDKTQIWNDWFIKSSPDGYPNLLAAVCGMRVRHARCFCLCGSYNNNHNQVFDLGSDKTFMVAEEGFISFFANDVRGFYGNNFGKISISVCRIQ